jgi:hypothetical protein
MLSEDEAYINYMRLEASYRTEHFRLMEPLMDMKACLLGAISVAEKNRLLTVNLVLDNVDGYLVHQKPALEAKMKRFPRVFVSGYAIRIFKRLVCELEHRIEAKARSHPRTEVDAAMRDWLALRNY